MWYHAKRVSHSSELLMDIVFSLQGVVFEWDDEKARLNQAQHGVTFEEAAEVFSSTRSISTAMPRLSECKNNATSSWATP